MDRKTFIGFGRSFLRFTPHALRNFALYALLFTFFTLLFTLYALPVSTFAADKLVVKDTGGVTQFVVTDTGNVGIGTASAMTKLNVYIADNQIVKVNEYATLMSVTPTDVPNWIGIAIMGKDDVWGRFGFGLNNGMPWMAFGPGNTNRDVWLHRNNGNLTFSFGTTPVEKMRLTSAGALYMASGAYVTEGGVWTNASSNEYKENIKDLSAEEAILAFNKLNPVTFSYKVDNDEKHVGFIAEDVPDLLATKDRKGLSPMDVVAVLTKIVQEQRKTISELTEKVNRLEKLMK